MGICLTITCCCCCCQCQEYCEESDLFENALGWPFLFNLLCGCCLAVPGLVIIWMLWLPFGMTAYFCFACRRQKELEPRRQLRQKAQLRLIRRELLLAPFVGMARPRRYRRPLIPIDDEEDEFLDEEMGLEDGTENLND